MKVLFYNNDDRMRDVKVYSEEYELDCDLVNSYFNEDGLTDVWVLEGEEENIESFIENYCLDLVIKYI